MRNGSGEFCPISTPALTPSGPLHGPGVDPIGDPRSPSEAQPGPRFGPFAASRFGTERRAERGAARPSRRAYPVPSRAPGSPKTANASQAGSPSDRIDSRASAIATASGRPALKAR